jgi:hypothetical protein
MTPQEAALQELARRELARREQAERERLAAPLPRVAAPAVEFAPPAAVQAEARAAAAEAAREEVAAPGVFTPAGVDVLARQERLRDQALAELERRRGRVAMPGVAEPVAIPEEAPLRPSRIETVQAFQLEPVEGAGVLRDAPEPTFVAEADLPAPFEPLTMAPVLRRMYQDPETGEYREPTLGEEFREAFALQTERGEAGLRERQAELAKEQREIDEALAAGEPVPFFKRYVGSPISGVLTEAEQGKGIVETELGAFLRSVLSWGSAAAADGYFRGLGYEVDENGFPIDPTDWGFEVAKARRALGLPEVISMRGGLAEAVDYYGKQTGASPETVTTLRNLVRAVPEFAIPLPGVATESQTRKVTAFDPEGRRRVEDVQFPSFTDDPGGFIRAEARRITQNVAKGRTFMDEYLDTPATRDFYAATTGDEDDAYLAGMLPEVLIPGPELLLGVPGYMVGGGARVLKLLRSGRAIRNAEKAATAATQAVRVAEAAGEPAEQVARLRQTAAQAVNKHTELADAAADYDPPLLRKVSQKAVDKVVGKRLPEEAKAAQDLLRGKGAPETLTEVGDVLRRVLPEDDVARVTKMVYRNLPGDFVLLTDTVAVPRRQLPEARKALREHRASLFVRDTSEMATELSTLAGRMAEGPARARVEQAAQDLRAVPGRGYSALPKPLRRQVEQAARAAAREVGEADPLDFARRLDQRKPAEVQIGDTPLYQELRRFKNWDDVPADLRRAVIDTYDVGVAPKLAKGARLTRDTTRAQLYFKTVEEGLGNPLRSRILDSPRMRRVLARRGSLQTETAAAANIAREIQVAGKQALRTLEKKLDARIELHGDFNKALEEVLVEELTAAGETPTQAWEALWSALYGDSTKEKLLEAVRADGTLPMKENGDFWNFPSVESARAIDRLYSGVDDPLPGVTPKLGDIAEGLGLGGIITPDFQNGLLRVILDNGIRKNIGARKTITGAVQTAVDDFILGTDLSKLHTDTLLDRARRALPVPGKGATLPSRLSEKAARRLGNRMQVYDKGAGIAEQKLAAAGAELAQTLDSVPLTVRADVGKMAEEWFSSVARLRRNVTERLYYGYILPNIPAQAGRLLKLGIVPLVTIGARNTLGAFDRAGQKALSAVTRRRLLGGGITDPAGVYYSPKMLEDLADDYALGVSTLESERVGSLARDLQRAVQRRARGVGGVDMSAALDELDPFSRGFFLRTAEALELNFRRSVFEMALARGDAPQDAAELARRSQLDLTEVPDAVRTRLGSMFAESAFLYRLGIEGMTAIAENPKRAGPILRAMRAKAEAQDPYNIHGDKALKTLGMFPGERKEDTYFLPENPAFLPVEAFVGSLRSVGNIMADIKFATKELQATRAELPGDRMAVADAIQFGGEVITPAVFDAWERFKGGQEYQPTDVPEAEPLSDEKVFWAMMLIANNRDPEHKNGLWNAFETYLPVEQVNPPEEFASRTIPGAWRRQPPEGVPHYLYDVIDGEPVYFAAKPTDKALAFIRQARALDVADLDRVLPFYAVLSERERPETPRRVYTEGALPTTLRGAALETFMGRGPGDVEQALERQAAQVRDIREQTAIE